VITRQQAAELKHGQILHHGTQRGSDKLPVRARVNGKVQFWVTRPGDFRIPIKSGLYAYEQISPSVAHAWFLTAEEAMSA